MLGKNLCLTFLLFIVFNVIHLTRSQTDDVEEPEEISFETADLFIPTDCESVVKPGDHLILQYELIYENGTTAYNVAPPSQLLHVTVSEEDDNNIQRGLKGMCKNATRKISWLGIAEISPLETLGLAMVQYLRSAIVTVVHLTEPLDFEIFRHIDEGNSSAVYEMLSIRHGALAVNEWGESTLMVTVRKEFLSSFSYIMNTRLPMVDMNFAKSSGHTVLFYAVQSKSTSMLKALLQRGADPTVTLKALGSEGSTPLHFAMLFERKAHAELLLQYGADPNAVNANGMTPLQLLPKDVSRRTKLQYKSMLEKAADKSEAPEQGSSARSDM